MEELARRRDEMSKSAPGRSDNTRQQSAEMPAPPSGPAPPVVDA
jgi:hypothetical protein